MKILICSDGSAQAEVALRLGSLIAEKCGAEVTLFGIIESPPDSEVILESFKRGQAALIEKKAPVEVITKTGEPIAEIVKRTEEAEYDLVVIGAVRKGNRGPYWMSSKSYKIIKEIKPPVLSVAGKSVSLSRILICSGGKHYIDNAVQLAGKIAKGTGASVVLLHVMPELPVIYSSLVKMEETAARLLESKSELGINLRRAKEALEANGVPVEVRLRQGSVLEGILRETQTGGYDMVVTGSALSRSLRTYVLGDVSREIVNRVNRAILVVRSQTRARHPRWSVKGIIERLVR